MIGFGPPLRGLVRIVSTRIDLDDNLMVTSERGLFNQTFTSAFDQPNDRALSLPPAGRRYVCQSGSAGRLDPTGIAESLV
jgi:hypothetical protein